MSYYDKTRLLTQTENGNVITYTYDVNGNMSTKACTVGEVTTQTVFTYDTFDRTASITLGNGVTTSFAYNTDSDRISKTTGNTITETVLDNGTISADVVSNNGTITTKVYTQDNSVYCQNGVFIYNVINSKGDLVATSESNDVDYKYECDKAVEADIKIVVLYNSITVSKSKCPESVRDIGTHVAMVYKGNDGKYYWDYNAVKEAIEAWFNINYLKGKRLYKSRKLLYSRYFLLL